MLYIKSTNDMRLCHNPIKRKKRLKITLNLFVGVDGFEPPTLCL